MHPFVSLLLLTSLSVTYSHASRRLERLRRAVTLNTAPDFLGAWTFAAVILLPPALIVVALGVFYLADWPSRRAAPTPHPWRHAYGWASASAAAVVSSTVLGRLGFGIGVPLALAAFTLVNIGLISLAMIVRHQGAAAAAMFRRPRSHLLELATQLTGVTLGAAMHWHLAACVIVLPILLATHYRGSLDAVEETAAYDPVMRLWNEAGWAFQASELISSGEMVTVFVIDGGASKAVVADVMRPCLTRSAVLGHYSKTQLVAICETGYAESAQVIVRRVAASLERGGADLPMGCRTARCEDLSEMLTHALSDLMAARDRAETAGHRW